MPDTDPQQATWRGDVGKTLTDEEYQRELDMYREMVGSASDPLAAVTAGASTAPARPAQQTQPVAAQPTINRADYEAPGAADLQRRLMEREQSVLGRSTDSDVRQGQMALAQQLQRYATGQDSASALQLQQARDANIAAQMALAAGARPGQSQLAALTAAQQIGSANTALAGQQALAGIQERAAAQNALGSLLGGTRGQDIQYGAQSDAAYQQALAQQLAASQIRQQGTMGYARDVQADIQQQRALAAQLAAAGGGSTWEKFLRGGTDLAAAYATMKDKDKGGDGGGGYSDYAGSDTADYLYYGG